MTTIDQMWKRFEQHQPFADERGYGKAWRKMCEERTEDAMRLTARATCAREGDVWMSVSAARLTAQANDCGAVCRPSNRVA
jgi:hypothetical protein